MYKNLLLKGISHHSRGGGLRKLTPSCTPVSLFVRRPYDVFSKYVPMSFWFFHYYDTKDREVV